MSTTLECLINCEEELPVNTETYDMLGKTRVPREYDLRLGIRHPRAIFLRVQRLLLAQWRICPNHTRRRNRRVRESQQPDGNSDGFCDLKSPQTHCTTIRKTPHTSHSLIRCSCPTPKRSSSLRERSWRQTSCGTPSHVTQYLRCPVPMTWGHRHIS